MKQFAGMREGSAVQWLSLGAGEELRRGNHNSSGAGTELVFLQEHFTNIARRRSSRLLGGQLVWEFIHHPELGAWPYPNLRNVPAGTFWR
jgi:hypothetical protein